MVVAHHKKIISSILIISLIVGQYLISFEKAHASTKDWDFASSGDYTFDGAKVEVSAGQAQLKETANWYDPAWGYRRAVTVDNTGSTTNHTNFQVQIVLSGANFDFSKANNDGSDIRFTDSDGTTLVDHWTEAYNNSGQSALITAEVPRISASSTKTIYIYYGNSIASSTSSWDNTFTTTPPALDAADIYTETTYDAFPAAELLQNGDILVAFRSGSTHISNDGEIMLARSSNGGSTWSTSQIYDEVGIDDRINIGLTQLSDGTLILPFSKYYGFEDVNSYILKSSDNGQTWGAPIQVTEPQTKYTFPYGKIIELTNGTLLMPGYGENTGQTSRSVLLQSVDDGDTWTLKSTIAYDGVKNYNETSVVKVSDTNYVAIVRGEDSPPNMYQTNSTDGGSTWSAPTLLFEGSSPSAIKLANNDLLLCVADRANPQGIRCHVSQDSGTTWKGGNMIFNAADNQDGDGGYPSVLELANGNLFSPYYHLISGSNTDISRVIFSESNAYNPNYANMFEGMEDGNLADWSIVTGTTTSVSSSTKRTGGYSFYINDTDAATLNRGLRKLNASQTFETGMVSFWVYSSTFQFQIGLYDTTTINSDERFWLSVDAAGEIKYHNGTTYVSLSPATTIASNTWTKISIKFNATTNTGEVFVNGVSKGAITRRFTGFYINYLGFTSYSQAGTGYIYYADDIYFHQYSAVVPTISVGSEVSVYTNTDPTINPTAGNAQSFITLSGFAETATKDGGEIKYQISNDAGSTWYWYNSGWTSTVTGYAEANTAADINTNIGTFPVGDGNFLFKAYLHSDGTQLVQLDAVTLTYSLDSEAPAISLNALSSDPNNDTTPALTGTATDAIGTVSSVEYQMDGTGGAWLDCDADDLAFNEASEAFTCNIAPALLDGSHTIYVRATDNGNNTTAALNYSTDTFTIDTSAPTINLTALSPDPNNDNTPTLSGNATDTYSNVSNVKYQMDGTGGSWTACTADDSSFNSNNENFTCNVSPALLDGAHTIYMQGTDSLGNVTSAGFETDGFTIDATAPSIPGVPSTATPTNDNTPAWSWAASTDDGVGMHATTPYSVQWCADNLYTGCGANVDTAATNSYTHSVSLVDGTWYFRAKSTDDLNNSSSYSGSGTVVIDTGAPTIAVTALSPDPNNDTTPAITGTATDLIANLTTIEFQVDSILGAWTSCSADDSVIDEMTETFTCSITGALGEGSHTIYIRGTDAASNTTAQINYGTDTFTIDTTAPNNGSIIIAGSAIYTKQEAVTLTISADNANQMMVSESAAFTGASWETYATSKPFTLSSTNGTKTVYIKFRDTATNESISYSDTIILDSVAPVAFNLSTPANSTYTTDQTPTFRFSSTTDATSGLSKYQLIVDNVVLIDDIDPTDPGGTHIREDAEKYVYYGSGYIELYAKQADKYLSEASHTWKVKAIDVATNSYTTSARTITVDMTNPTILLQTISGETANIGISSQANQVIIITDQTPSFNGTGETGSLVTISIASGSYICTATISSGSWTCNISQSIPYGTYLVNTTVVDLAGNTSNLPVFYINVAKAEIPTEIVTPTPEETAQTPEEQPQEGTDTNTGGEVPEQEEKEELYRLTITVIDQDGNPVEGAEVTIFSDPVTTFTDVNGIAFFDKIAKGEHKVLISYENQSGEQVINLTGDQEDVEFTIKISPEDNTINTITFLIIGGLTASAIIFLILFLRKRKNKFQS